MSEKSIVSPIIVGLVVGITFVILFASLSTFKPIQSKTNNELVAESRNSEAVNYFLSKYPNGQVDVIRGSAENYVVIRYSGEGGMQA